MIRCEKCDKEFKSNAGLSRHIKSCKGIINEMVGNKEQNDETKRKLAKLRDARASTFDAEARHKFDLQIKEIED